MKKLLNYLVIGSALLALTGCATTEFGMPKSQFDQLSPQQKQKVIARYNKRQTQKEQQAPMSHAIGAIGQALHASANIPFMSSNNSSTRAQNEHDSSSSSSVTHGPDWTSSKTYQSEHSHFHSDTSKSQSGGSFHFGVG